MKILLILILTSLLLSSCTYIVIKAGSVTISGIDINKTQDITSDANASIIPE